MMDLAKVDFKKSSEGIVPCVVQSADTLEVLMLAYMNKEALEKTIEVQKLTFFSRSKNRLWTKGETSGHFLKLIDLQLDCDGDTLLALVQPQGPACHTQARTCFQPVQSKHPLAEKSFLYELENTIKVRSQEDSESSYTARLFNEGLDRIAQKVGEEAVETILAAKNTDDQKFIEEASDLMYHLSVLLQYKNLSLLDINKELKKRSLKK